MTTTYHRLVPVVHFRRLAAATTAATAAVADASSAAATVAAGEALRLAKLLLLLLLRWHLSSGQRIGVVPVMCGMCRPWYSQGSLTLFSNSFAKNV